MTHRTRAQALQDLNDALRAANDHMYSIDGIGDAAVDLGDGHQIAWMHAHPKDKMRCLCVWGAKGVQPILEASIAHRKAAAMRLPELLAAALETQRREENGLIEAIEAARAFARGEHR